MTEAELKRRTKAFAPRVLKPVVKEADELTAIMIASRRTTGSKNQKSRIENRK